MTTKGDLLIRGGTVIDPTRNLFGKTDVLIQSGRIIELRVEETADAEKVIDATGHLVLP